MMIMLQGLKLKFCESRKLKLRFYFFQIKINKKIIVLKKLKKRVKLFVRLYRGDM